MFKYKESYKHLYAKRLLAEWCKEAESSDKFWNSRVAQFQWRSNYGVFEELVFHETDNPYYFECSKGLKSFNENDDRFGKPLELFDKKYNRGKILFVPDVTIFHKGTPLYLFEIVHTSPTPPKKIKQVESFFEGYHVEVYEIDAEFILKQTATPKTIKCEQLL